MTLFACAIRLDGGPAPEPAAARAVDRYAGERAIAHHSASGMRALVAARAGDVVSAGVVRIAGAVGVGVARLDDRAAIRRRLVPRAGDAMGDLELVVRHLAAGLPAERIPGDFAVVVWHPATRRLVAARDALGVRRLFWTTARSGVVAFASHAGLLASGDDAYDLDYLAEWISACEPAPDRTAYAGVRALPGGSVLRLRGDVPDVAAFWTPRGVQEAGAPAGCEEEQCATFRALLIDGVRARLDDGAGTWAQLSGGLDSSSVVSVAQWLAERGVVSSGLAGTVSYVDHRGTAADERVYSDAVVRRWGVPNVAVPHQAGWRDVLDDPPDLDQPSSRSYFVAARDRAVVRAVRGAGGRVLLTGIGGDHLALGTMFFFADWVARGELRRAGREMLRRAALGRVSFWRLAYENALLPLLPARVRRTLLGGEGRGGVPPWVMPGPARRVERAVRTTDDGVYGGRWGSKYADTLAAGVAAIQSQIPGGAVEGALDVRHPFLHRPLVEFALRLPPELCVRPHARKWILREAMRGILPDAVRTRVGKGSGSGLMVWSLAHERAWTDELLRDPILAQLGCIDPAKVRDALARVGARARDDADDDPALLAVRTLEVEMWLRVRAGRWVAAGSRAGGSRTSRAAGA